MKPSAAGKNDPCPCSSGRKYRQCCWLRRFDRATTATAVKGQFESCKCGSGKKYRRCCYPRVFPDFTKRNGGIEPHLERAAEDRAFARMQALFDHGLPSNQTIDTIEVGTGRLDCAALPPTGPGENVAGTLGPPTARQVEAKYDTIRDSNPDGVTEVVVTYTYPEMFGHAEARMVFDADEHFRLEDGSVVSVLKLSAGMRLRMADGGIGTIVEHPERRYEYPLPPMQYRSGKWSSRVIGRVKHTTHEIAEFRWAGQEVQVTPAHLVWSADRGAWVRAHELRNGELIRVSGNTAAPVEGYRLLRLGLVEVFGIEVEYFHNYFVGTGPNALLVHNGPDYIGKPATADVEAGKVIEDAASAVSSKPDLTKGPVFEEIAIVGPKGKLGEFDKVLPGLFVEEKSATGISKGLKFNPGRTYAEAAEIWAESNVYKKTATRIENIPQATQVIPEKGPPRPVPTLEQIQSTKKFHFQIDETNPDLMTAVNKRVEQLRSDYPDHEFTVEFGK